MKWFKYTGLYFMIMSVGYAMLEFMNVNDVWFRLFIIGGVFYYCAKLGEKDN